MGVTEITMPLYQGTHASVSAVEFALLGLEGAFGLFVWRESDLVLASPVLLLRPRQISNHHSVVSLQEGGLYSARASLGLPCYALRAKMLKCSFQAQEDEFG